MTRMKIALVVLGVLVLTLAVLVIALMIDDRRYPTYTYEAVSESERQGLLVTWHSTQAEGPWPAYEAELLPELRRLQAAGEVAFVLALEHPPLTHPELGGAWSHALVVVLESGISPAQAESSVLAALEAGALSEGLRAVDRLRLQPGLDRFYPVHDGFEREARLRHTIEYVFSEPEARPEYYRDQRVFSGPAMADLHARDKAGRFIGFEVEQRLVERDDTPAWDVVHIIGFTRWQEFKSVPFFFSTWNKHAERAYGEGASFRDRLAAWDAIRINVKSEARLRMGLSLQATHP